MVDGRRTGHPIKDRTSNSGASRVYASLIDGRDWSYGRGGRDAIPLGAPAIGRSLPAARPRPHPPNRRVHHRAREQGKTERRAAPEAWSLGGSGRVRCVNCSPTAVDVDIVSYEVVVAIDDAIQSGDRVAALNSLRLTVWLGYRTQPDTGKYPWWPWMESILRAHAAKVTVAAEEDYGIRNVALRHGLISVSQALEMPGGLTALFLQSRSLFPSLGLFPDLRKIHICVCCAAGPRSPACHSRCSPGRWRIPA